MWDSSHTCTHHTINQIGASKKRKKRRRYHHPVFHGLKISLFLQVIAENLSEEEIMGLKEMFKSMDTDNSGTITYEELKAGLPKLGTKLSESEVKQLMEAVISLVSFILLLELNGTFNYLPSFL